MSPVPVPLRLLRAGLFAGVCVVLAVGGHVFASDDRLPAWAVWSALAAGFAVGMSGAGRECSLARIAVPMTAGQAVLHEWFTWAAGQPAAHTAGGPHAAHHAGHAADPGAGPVLGHVARHGGVPMLAAHLLVAVAAAVWLRVGEAALFRLSARLDDRVRSGVRALLVLVTRPQVHVSGPGPLLALPAGAARLRPQLLTRYDLVRRGPPPAHPAAGASRPGRRSVLAHDDDRNDQRP